MVKEVMLELMLMKLLNLMLETFDAIRKEHADHVDHDAGTFDAFSKVTY
jgi:hypothetical protein